MKLRRAILTRSDSGQSLVETVLILPLLLLLLLNALNFGYFFLVTLNLTASPRAGVEYSIYGPNSPGTTNYPAAGGSSSLTVSDLSQQDMTGALSRVTSAPIQVCSQTNLTGTPPNGVNGTGTSQKSNCITCTNGTCGAVTTTPTYPPHADPEAPTFILHRVDVTYTFIPLIPGQPFNLFLLASPLCNASGTSCTFHRFAEMRAM